MIKYCIIYCLAIMAIITQPLSAQEKKTEFKKVNISEALPDYTLANVINYPTESVSFKDFKGKILILDFWNFYCTSCVRSWPKLMEDQEKFKGKIQYMLVNTQNTAEEVKKFIAKQEKINGYKMTLPVACGDTNLVKLFPHRAFPHVVFIDKNGIVKYITLSQSDKFIQMMLDGKPMVVPEKIDDFAIDVQWNKPLFIDGNISSDTISKDVPYSCIITPFTPNMDEAYVSFVDSKINIRDKRALGVLSGMEVKFMLRLLYGREYDQLAHNVFPVPNPRILFKDVDTSKLVKRINGIRQYQNRYTIQITSKNDIPAVWIKKNMISTLEQNFGIHTGWEKMKRKCFVISRTGSALSDYKTGVDSLYIGGKIFNFNNIDMQSFIERLIFFTSPLLVYPVVDETNFKGKLGDIKLRREDVVNTMSLNKALQKYGFKILVEDREVDMLVITKLK